MYDIHVAGREMYKPDFDDLGDPSLTIADLCLWIHDEQCSDEILEEYGEIVKITVYSYVEGCEIWFDMKFYINALKIGFGNFIDQCEKIYGGEGELAELEIFDYEFSFRPKIFLKIGYTDQVGHVTFEYDISPDPEFQRHNILIPIDQSYLPGIIKDCKKSLKKLSEFEKMYY